jgi:hypothetical protein
MTTSRNESSGEIITPPTGNMLLPTDSKELNDQEIGNLSCDSESITLSDTTVVIAQQENDGAKKDSQSTANSVTLEKMLELVVSQIKTQSDSLHQDAIESITRTAQHVIEESVEVMVWALENQTFHTSDSLVIIHHGVQPKDELFEAMYTLVRLAVTKEILSPHSGIHLTKALIAQLTHPKKIRPEQKTIQHHYLDDKSEQTIAVKRLEGANVIIPICPGRQPLGGSELQKIITLYQRAGVKSFTVYLGAYDNLFYSPEDCKREEKEIWAAWENNNKVTVESNGTAFMEVIVTNKDESKDESKANVRINVINSADFRKGSAYQEALKFLFSLEEKERALFIDSVAHDTEDYFFNEKRNGKVRQTAVDVIEDQTALDGNPHQELLTKLVALGLWNRHFIEVVRDSDPDSARNLFMNLRLVLGMEQQNGIRPDSRSRSSSPQPFPQGNRTSSVVRQFHTKGGMSSNQGMFKRGKGFLPDNEGGIVNSHGTRQRNETGMLGLHK